MNEYDRVNEKMNRIVSQLERIADGQIECNWTLQGVSDKMPPRKDEGFKIVDCSNVRIKQLEEELTEANEKLVEQEKILLSGSYDHLIDPFDGNRVINHEILVYWERLIENHVTDEKFTSLDHAIVYLVDKYPKRKEG